MISRTSQKQLKNESKQQGETFRLDTCSNHFIAHDCNRNYSLNWIEIEKVSSLYLNAVRNKFDFFCLFMSFLKIILRIDPDATFMQAEMEFAAVLKGPLLITSHFKIIIFAFEISLKLKLNGVLKIDFLVRLKTINWASSEASSEKSRKDIHFMSQLVEPKSRSKMTDRAARSRVIERISVLLLWNIKFAFNFTQFKEVYRCLEFTSYRCCWCSFENSNEDSRIKIKVSV